MGKLLAFRDGLQFSCENFQRFKDEAINFVGQTFKSIQMDFQIQIIKLLGIEFFFLQFSEL